MEASYPAQNTDAMHLEATHLDATRARRAIGAMVLVVFGGVWLGFWDVHSHAGAAAMAVIVALGLGLLAGAWLRYRRYAPALAQAPVTPERRRAKRVFNIVNAIQWILILGLGNVLAHRGLVAWVLPMAIFVVGLHFLPLAYVFHNPPYYLTGLAMALFAIVYPFVAEGGPGDPVGGLGAGLILWLNAAWALRPDSAPART